MASTTSTGDDALHDTAAALGGFASIPLDVISTHMLSHDFLPEPRDLGRLRAVSTSMRDAVDATGREIKQLSDEDAARLGYFSLLKDRHSRGLLEDENLLCAAAARNGDLEALKALLEDGCECDGRTCEATAEGGHLEVLQWLHENDLWWEEDEDYGCAYAAHGGHLEMLKWLHENDFEWDEETCAGAAEHATSRR